jgi:hypothetical protein
MDTDNICVDDLITLEEIHTWDITALKEYCRKRNFKVSGSKAELCARVYVLYNQRVPEEPGAREREASRKTDYGQLHNAVIPATDPNRLTKWISEQEGIHLWPPVSYIDIYKFIMKHGSSFSTNALTAYKAGKGFGYFAADWLKEVDYHEINKTHKHCYLRAQCTPSNAINNEKHVAWVKAVKKDGEVVSAYCSCVAG